jgi:hypothetical protein
MMTDTKYKGTILSFWNLLQKHRIEIPIIQRDYAQGREDKKEIRDRFLNALFQSINDKSLIKLDFIYGSVELDVFQPLDGQQRLTTLFLLHWYAAMKDNALTDEIINNLQKFSYETRITSRDFCSTLVSHSFNINGNGMLSSKIIDSSWFYLSWKKDPTIDAMLRTLDDIDKVFYQISGLWEKLISNDNVISFYHVELENIGLTDDLYIKMNARGKLLSPYENFKAVFQKYINDNKWEENIDFIDTFANKIDSIWTDVFWKHRKKNTIDEAIIRFIASVLMIRESNRKSDDRFSVISGLQDEASTVRAGNFDRGDFNYLCKSFDVYHKAFENSYNLDLPFTLFQHTPTENIFSATVYEGQNASYSQKVLFFAQTEYLLRAEEFTNDKYLDWMRVIRNIISRGDVSKNGKRPTIIRSPQTFDGVIKLISELATGCENIYDHLSSGLSIKSTFAKEQIEEEKLKAKIIISDISNKDIIHKAEDSQLLMGRIEFALYCIDCNSLENFNSNSLERINDIIYKYLNSDSSLSNDLRRALLTISDNEGNYDYYGYWWSFWYVAQANKRCLIDKYRELEYFIYGNYKNRDMYRIYLKKLIIELKNKDLQTIVDDFLPPSNMPNWKQRLIKDSNLLDDNSKSNYIAIPDDNSCCYLLKSMRPRDIEGCEKIL